MALQESITFDTTSVNEFAVQIRMAEELLPAEIDAATKQAMTTLRRAIGQLYGKNLARKWTVTSSTAGDLVTITASTNDPIVSYYEFGTRPHIISARNAHVLRFQMHGQVVFAKYVHHPGTHAHNKLDRLRTSFSNSVTSSWQTAIDNAVDKAF